MKKRMCAVMAMLMILMHIPVYAGVETSAKAVILTEQTTGRVLAEKNADERLPIASVTKIMTMLLIMEEIDSGRMTLADNVTVSEHAMSFGGSTMFLEAGEVLTVSDMLKGIAVASANDGCVAMAEHISGSTDAFVERMNVRAKELGMENTHFVNTNGLDAPEHYSSARDVAIMARELCRHDKIFDYTTIWTDSLRDGKFLLANTNKLVRFYRGATGLKTGSTDAAGCCLCATATRDGLPLIAVVLGAPTSKERFADASSLLDYGFANYKTVNPASKGEPAGSIRVRKGRSDTVNAVYAEDFAEVIPKTKSGEISAEVTLPDVLVAPIDDGEVIGRAEFFIAGESIGSVDLKAETAVEKKGFISMLADVLRGLIGA